MIIDHYDFTNITISQMRVAFSQKCDQVNLTVMYPLGEGPEGYD